MIRNIQSKGQFCAEWGEDEVPFKTLKRQKMYVPRRPPFGSKRRAHPIVRSSEHNELGLKLTLLSTGEMKLEMPD